MKTAIAGWLAAAVLRLLRASLRLRHHGDAALRQWEREGTHFVLAFWHRHLLLMRYAYRGRQVTVMVSMSRDGELSAAALRHLGVHTARGSTSRGGARGLRELLRRAGAGSDIAFTPDGPRGPRGEVQPGVLLAAQSLGWPIVPVAYAASRAKATRSWDGMKVVLPLARVHFVYGEPLWIARGEDLGSAGRVLKAQLDRAEELALEHCARAGAGS
jgi:lysophospholipid acyltransferase (LPLAT)-like uncharacterized protein